jgi:hypothetical protein
VDDDAGGRVRELPFVVVVVVAAAAVSEIVAGRSMMVFCKCATITHKQKEDERYDNTGVVYRSRFWWCRRPLVLYTDGSLLV